MSTRGQIWEAGWDCLESRRKEKRSQKNPSELKLDQAIDVGNNLLEEGGGLE